MLEVRENEIAQIVWWCCSAAHLSGNAGLRLPAPAPAFCECGL